MTAIERINTGISELISARGIVEPMYRHLGAEVLAIIGKELAADNEVVPVQRLVRQIVPHFITHSLGRAVTQSTSMLQNELMRDVNTFGDRYHVYAVDVGTVVQRILGFEAPEGYEAKVSLTFPNVTGIKTASKLLYAGNDAIVDAYVRPILGAQKKIAQLIVEADTSKLA
jgi:hypothetical protein